MNKLEVVANLVTWHKWTDATVPQPGWLIRDKDGVVSVVGDVHLIGESLVIDGCGCCADEVSPVAYADLLSEFMSLNAQLENARYDDYGMS